MVKNGRTGGASKVPRRQRRRPADEQWTGAEIRACCRLAALLDLPLVQAAQHVVPVAVTNAESLQRLRRWASGRCLSADCGGIYQQPAASGQGGAEGQPGPEQQLSFARVASAVATDRASCDRRVWCRALVGASCPALASQNPATVRFVETARVRSSAT